MTPPLPVFSRHCHTALKTGFEERRVRKEKWRATDDTEGQTKLRLALWFSDEQSSEKGSLL